MLRLVSADDAGEGGMLPRDHGGPIARVRQANLDAASLPALDARWVLASRASRLIEGGRAAVLSPERRERLRRLASDLGLRPFDAGLIIAIVQDAARAGEDPLGRDAESRLRLVRPAEVNADSPERLARLLLLSALLGAAAFLALVLWLR